MPTNFKVLFVNWKLIHKLKIKTLSIKYNSRASIYI